MPVYFADGPEDEMNNIVNINVYGTLNITRLVLPKMVEKYDLPIAGWYETDRF